MCKQWILGVAWKLKVQTGRYESVVDDRTYIPLLGSGTGFWTLIVCVLSDSCDWDRAAMVGGWGGGGEN